MSVFFEDSFSSDEHLVPFETRESNHEGFSIVIIIGLIFISLLCSKVFPTLLNYIVFPYFSFNLNPIFRDVSTPIISELSLLIIPYISSKFTRTSQVIPFKMKFVPNNLFKAFGFFLCFFALSISLISPNMLLNQNYSVITSLFVNCIFPSICEEIFFRGWVLFYFSQNLQIFNSILLTSILFSICHPFRSFFSSLLIFILSAGWTYANISTNSLIVSICCHFLHNFSQSTLLIMFPEICKIFSSFVSFALWLLASMFLYVLFDFHNETYQENESEYDNFQVDSSS
ncbi:hypothetical protein TRFO_22434 [Tritrichomonas foetus]|uniref:CAAX prenyl protease 2/Lysostaphin resistance protein A-like domain-containing protein n=1 Tax=Tritrichomonas foetus TaxID=1144522 RepID=A0A1J4KD71_9EUKA|nr:hypothetical protein TRFO_22434 [Tritrichomonas foetus]|eukprot:OHT08922.1 hypothetical protein TRFO_22434 [Tritrichomonas foetus]